MKTATVREVRHEFRKVMDWVQDGETVEISKRGEVIALISPPPVKRVEPPGKRPDFLDRIERIYGKDWRRRIPKKNAIVLDRESREF